MEEAKDNNIGVHKTQSSRKNQVSSLLETQQFTKSFLHSLVSQSSKKKGTVNSKAIKINERFDRKG